MNILAIAITACACFVGGYICGAIFTTGARYDDRLHELYGIDQDDEEIIR